MMKHKKFKVDVYGAVVYVTTDAEEASRLAWSKFGYVVPVDDFNGPLGMNIYSGAENIIWLPLGADEGTIAHECTHAAMNIFRTKGVVVDLDNQEPTTYLVGYLVRRVTAAARKLWEDKS